MNLVYSSLYIVLLGIVLSSLKLNIYVYIQADDCGILIRSSRSDTKLFGLKISMLDRLKRALKPNRSKPRISLSQKISLFKFLFHNFEDTSFFNMWHVKQKRFCSVWGWTTYDCNNFYDQICLQFWSKKV